MNLLTSLLLTVPSTPEPIPGFFGTLIPYLLIAALVVGSVLLSFFRFGNEAIERLFVILIPISLATATALELLALYSVGNDAIWWCDPDRYGFWGGFFRLIPLFIILACQAWSIFGYESFLSKTEFLNDKDVSISLKPTFISMLLALPLAVIVAYVLQFQLHVPKIYQEIGLIGTFVVILVIGLGMAIKNNIQRLGTTFGFVITVFTIFYVLGIFAVIWLLIVGLFQMIFQEAIIIGVCALFFFKSGIADDMRSMNKNKSTVFYDKHGGQHTNGADADAYNRTH
jgi:hypothetical protein